MIHLSPNDQNTIDRVFATLHSTPSLEIPGCVRVKHKGTTEVWIRRGPLLLYGTGVFLRLYNMEKYDATSAIIPGRVPSGAVEVTRARGHWKELLVLALADIVDSIYRAVSAGSVDEPPKRIDAAQHSLRKFDQAREHKAPPWNQPIVRGRGRS